MTEEQVTRALLRYLMENGWQIVCFDFPQSGTGRMLHPDRGESEKNRGSIIPDIVAVKNDMALFFENKDRFYLPDFRKVNGLMGENPYAQSIAELLSDHPVRKICYGIGLPTEKHGKGSEKSAYLVNFILGVDAEGTISILHNPENIPFRK